MVRETRHLWVGNLPHTIREERILDHFKRYGKVQSVKILPKKEEESGACATVAFIDIKSAAKAHNADNKIDDRTLKTDYYEPPASSTASSAIYIHERDDALVRPAPAPYSTPRTPRYGLPEERNYERPGHYYGDREPYLRRPIGMGYHDEDNYQGRAKSRDRYSRSNSGNTYTEGTERNQNHFRAHNARQHFEQQRYPVGEQYNDERDPAATTQRLNRRTNNTPTTPVVQSVASPTTTRSESRPRRTKRRSPSRTPSGSRSNSGSRSRSLSSSDSRSSSSSSKLNTTSSDSSGRSRSPSKSRSPAASYGSQNNAKGSRLDRPSSAIANPSSTVCYLPSAVNTSAINCTTNNNQGSTPTQNCPLATVENNCEKEEKRPLGICVRNLPVRSTDTSLKDGLFHEYKKHGKVTMVKVIGQGTERYAVVCFKKPEDVDKALEVSKDKLFFGCKIEVTAHEGLDAEDNEFRPLEAELDEFHPKATRTLFIGNLEKDITTAELRKHFDQFGEIIEIDIKKQGSATSYAFIQYSDIASVVKAMRKLDGENLGANRIKLGFGKSMPTNCVWLDGIVDTVSDKFLARHFSRFGIVASTAVDREKGHALVLYDSVEFAQIAVSEMRGRILQGKKLQVDFASRECQTAFFEKLEMTGQMVPGDGTRLFERRERRGPEFEVIRNDDRDARLGFDNRVYARYEGQPRPNRGNFRGGRANFSTRGRGQGFSARYEVYHDEFGERRHRYNSREDSAGEVTMFDGKLDRGKYGETPDCPNRKRNKLRNSISDQESHHSQSPPRSRHQSRSTSPVCKDRKSLKDRLHHRIKSPSSHNSSLVSSPCRDAVLDEMETNFEYRDSRIKNTDIKGDDVMTELSYTSPRNAFEKEGSEKLLSKLDCDLFKSRSSLDAESADEAGVTSDQLGQLERKKRLLASSNLRGGKELNSLVSKTLTDKTKMKVPANHNNILKTTKVNCVSGGTTDDVKSDTESVNVQQECTKAKPHQSESANADLMSLEKRQKSILNLLEQLHDGHSSDTEGSVDGERLARKKHRSLSNLDASTFSENSIVKSVTKDDTGGKLCKSGIKDPMLFKLKKTDGVDNNNGISLSLDSIFRKHLDPRKGFDQHSVSLSSVNSLSKCRRISMDSDTCLPNAQGATESFLYVPSSIAAEVSWKKQCNTLNDIHFAETDADSSLSISHFKIKDEHMDDDILINKKSLSHNLSLPLDMPKNFLTLRTCSDSLSYHEVKRDSSPLSLPLPKFAASLNTLRSPKSSPSVLTSPKSTAAHSPRAGLSPSSFMSSKNMRIPDLHHDVSSEKKSKDTIPDDKMNGATISPVNSVSPLDSQAINETSESMPKMEPIQSPKNNSEKIKEFISSSESDLSPSSSPNRPSIEDRIKALDEKFNAWSGSTRTASTTTTPDSTPSAVVEVPKCPPKRCRFNFLTSTEIRSEPSDIVKSLLARSTIFDQDLKRLQHINEKYDPVNVKMDLSPKVKPAFRTKAAAKEFSPPITPSIQNFNQSLLMKSSSVLVAQGIMSPPATPQSATGSILSPITPPLTQYSQLPPNVYTPCSPRATSFNLPSTILKSDSSDNLNVTSEKDITDHVLKASQVFNSIKPKSEPSFHVNSTILSTSVKSNPLTCPVETPSHGLVLNSPVNVKKEPASPSESITETVCKIEVETKAPIKKEVLNSTCIPLKDSSVSTSKEHLHFNTFGHDKKEACDSKDPRLSFQETNQWKENCSKDDIKVNVDSCAKSFNSISTSDSSEKVALPAVKKRVSSIDSNESDSSKSLKSLESSRDSQEIAWSKQDKTSEPDAKKPKLSKSSRERSVSPPILQSSKKSEKREKNTKNEKSKNSTSKSNSSNASEKVKHESKCNVKSEYKDKPKSDHKIKDEKRSKSRDSKDSKDSVKSEQKNKPRERRNSDKDSKNGHSSNPSSKPKKESTSVVKSDKCNEKKQNEKKSSSSKSKSSKFDFQAFMDEEPVYFSMYDKVKARSSKSQTLKHQVTSDLESVRQKFSKLKQSRAKREEKSKSVELDSDKESDSVSHHSSESDSQAKSTKVKQQRKRKLVIESSSDDDAAPHDTSNQAIKNEKDFSDSATDSDFDYNVSQRQSSTSKQRKKKAELLDTDSSDSDSTCPSKTPSSGRKKPAQTKSKPSRPEKSKKIIKSDEEMSEIETSNKNKDNKSKKLKKEKMQDVKTDHEVIDSDVPKKSNDDMKNSKKKPSKESNDNAVSKKIKSEHAVKDKNLSNKDKKVESVEKMQVEDCEKHKPYSKKRKKSKKLSRSREKRTTSDKTSSESSRKQPDESDTKSSLPVLLSPKPSSPPPDKQLSPPCLQAGMLSDNDFKSDFSDFDFETQQTEEMDLSTDLWKQLDVKSDSNSEKSSKSKRKESNVTKSQSSVLQSPEQDSSLPSFFDKLSDITDSETGKEPADCTSDVPGDSQKHTFPAKKEKETFANSASPLKNRHEKHDDQNVRQDPNKYSDNYSCSPKDERRKKKSKKQCKERKKKIRDETVPNKDVIADSVSSPKPLLFETLPVDDDSRLSDIRLDEEIAEEARRLEQELLAASEETSTFGDEGPAKREEKLLERRFEEEAAKETRRLEAELFSTGRDSWHMKEKEYDSEANSGELCEDKHGSEIDSLAGKDENMFAGLEMHSSVAEPSQNESDVFLSGHSESDPYKLDDKDVTNEIEDQRKIEDDLAVSALLQEMHCGEISAPELTKETDYLDMETHPDDTMNYLLPDDGENSLHIADSSPDHQGSESQDVKLDSSVMELSPSSNSEPPALEISNVEDSSLMKLENANQTCQPESVKSEAAVEAENHEQKNNACYEFQEESSVELSESKPPVIDIPVASNTLEHTSDSVSPKVDTSKVYKKQQKDKTFRMPSKIENTSLSNDETDDEFNSELTENQLTHFEDITMDITDSKDDDNPPILLPVESPRNLLPVTDSEERMESLPKVDEQDAQCIENIMCKTTASNENMFNEDSDVDKQIGNIMNQITELHTSLNCPKTHENNFGIPDSSDRTPIPLSIPDFSNHNSGDSLSLTNTGIFDNAKPLEHVSTSCSFDSTAVLKPAEKIIPIVQKKNGSSNFPDQNIPESKFMPSEINEVHESTVINYTDILAPTCETSVIQSPQKADTNNDNLTTSEKNSIQTIESYIGNSEINNITNSSNVSSDDFLLDLFGPKNDETEKIEDNLSDKHRTDCIDDNAETKNKVNDGDEQNQQDEITPLFEIPEVNEQNEATEFNQEIFERPSDAAKESKLPQLLSFSSEQLFPESTNDKKDSDTVPEISSDDIPSLPEDQGDEYKINVAPNSESKSMIFSDFDVKKSDDDLKFEDNNLEQLKDENLNIEDSLENKTRPGDAESVCSDTTDITIPETKVETEVNQITSSEEQIQEEVCPVEETVVDTKPKVERPRRGRRPKTRKYLEAMAQQKLDPLPETPVTPSHSRSSSRRVRPTSSERTRRSLRSDKSELSAHRESHENKQVSLDEAVHDKVEEVKKDSLEENNTETDGAAVEIDSTIPLNASHTDADMKLPDKIQAPKNEEPKRRRGRRKKASGDHSSSQVMDKIEHKSDEHEQSKDFNRPKESRFRLSLSSEKEQKSTKENTSAYDIFEFRDSEDDEISFDNNRLHDNKSASNNDQKHESKLTESLPEKEKKVDESKQKSVSSEEREAVSKENHTEVNQHRKISITIRFHQKDGHDGTSAGTAEVVKTSEALNIEEGKSEPPKAEKSAPSKQEASASDVPYNGPCKSTRKSPRLMNQASRSTVDEVIEEVAKGNFKVNNSISHSEPCPARGTRRSRSNWRSEESLTVPSENSEDNAEDKKNEPVFFILDNTIKDVTDGKKSAPNHSTETSGSDAPTSESDKNTSIASLRSFRITRSIASKLESNKDNSVAPNLTVGEHESQKKDNVSSSDEKFDSLQQKENQEPVKELKCTSQDNSVIYRPPLPVLKVELPRVVITNNANAKELLSKQEKLNENEDSDSSSNPTVLIDPVTGLLTPVNKSESYPENSNHSSSIENKSILVSDFSGISSSIRNINVSKTSTVEASTVSSVIQESTKILPPNSNEIPVGSRVPSVQSLRSRQLSSSIQLTGTIPTVVSSASPSETSSKPQNGNEKNVEHLKLPSKKAASSAVGVLTMANSAVPTIFTGAVVNESASTPVSTNTHISLAPSPVITSHVLPATCSSTVSTALSQDKKENVQTPVLPKISHSAHAYQPSVRAIVTAVVTATSMGHPATLPSIVQNKCSTSVTTASSSVSVKSETKSDIKAELPAVYSSTNPPTTVNENVSSNSCKAISLTVPISSEHSNIPSVKQEMHSTPSANATHSSSWSSSKIPSSRITDVHSHVSTIQTSAVSNPVFTTKSESRPPKVAHASKGSSAFAQQSGFPISSYEASVHGAHGIAGASNNTGSVVAELLQNPQLLQQHKEYFAVAASNGQLQERIQNLRPTTPVVPGIPPDIAARLGNPTPPHTPTPPVTSTTHSIPPSEIHPAHVNSSIHLRHPTQPPLIVAPHPSLGLHHSDLNAYVHQQMLYAANSYAAMHPDLRAQQEARIAAIGMNPRFAFPPIPPPTVVAANNFRQPSESRHQPSVMDAKSEQKMINDLSKIMHETRNDEKPIHSVKSVRIKKEDKDLKMIHSDGREEHESRHSSHEKIPSTSAIAPHSLRQPQHAPYSSTIRQVSPRLSVSSLERITDSPVIANLYAANQGRVSQIPIPGKVDEHKPENGLSSLSAHHYKTDTTEIKPPVAHQTQPSTIPYHALEAGVHSTSRQQMLGVLPIGSSAAGHLDARTSNPAHSPSSHAYKKESGHTQQLSSMHNPASDKRLNPEHSKKVVHARTHQGSSISPAPVVLGPAHSPLPWQAVIQSHNTHPSLAQSPHVMLSSNEQSSRRNAHMTPQMGSEVPIHAPPPAHAMSQPTNVPRTLTQTPPHASQVPSHEDSFVLQHYPVMWQGLLALKNDQAAVQMHFVSGNPGVARSALPPVNDEASVRISQRMRLEQQQLEGVYRKIQMIDEHCILIALPCGKDHSDVIQQSNFLKTGFINYLQCKQAAGIVNAAAPFSQQPAYVIHIFPSCEFTENNLARIAPDLLRIICDITHLVIIIATV